MITVIASPKGAAISCRESVKNYPAFKEIASSALNLLAMTDELFYV
jgi:hypothetical protein